MNEYTQGHVNEIQRRFTSCTQNQLFSYQIQRNAPLLDSFIWDSKLKKLYFKEKITWRYREGGTPWDILLRGASHLLYFRETPCEQEHNLKYSYLKEIRDCSSVRIAVDQLLYWSGLGWVVIQFPFLWQLNLSNIFLDTPKSIAMLIWLRFRRQAWWFFDIRS